MHFFTLRCIVVTGILLLAAGVAGLCSHLRWGRWSVNSFGLEPVALNITPANHLNPETLNLEANNRYISPVVTFLGIFISAMTFVCVMPLFLTSLFKRSTTASNLLVEVLWVFMFNVLWLGYASLALVGTHFPITASCLGVSLCMEIQALKVITLLLWLILFLYFMLLLTLAAVGASRGNRNVMSLSTTRGEFFKHQNLLGHHVATHQGHFNHDGFAQMHEPDSESVYSRYSNFQASRTPTTTTGIPTSRRRSPGRFFKTRSLDTDLTLNSFKAGEEERERGRSRSVTPVSSCFTGRNEGWHELKRVEPGKTHYRQQQNLIQHHDAYKHTLKTHGHASQEVPSHSTRPKLDLSKKSCFKLIHKKSHDGTSKYSIGSSDEEDEHIYEIDLSTPNEYPDHPGHLVRRLT